MACSKGCKLRRDHQKLVDHLDVIAEEEMSRHRRGLIHPGRDKKKNLIRCSQKTESKSLHLTMVMVYLNVWFNFYLRFFFEQFFLSIQRF